MTDKIKVYEKENDWITNKLVDRVRQGSLEKSLQDQLNIMCDGIIQLIDNEYPIKTIFDTINRTQVMRNLLIMHCINYLSANTMLTWNKNVTDSDDVER